MTDTNYLWINGKFLSQPKTGVQRYSIGMCHALLSRGFELKILVNKDFENPFPNVEPIVVGRRSGVIWEQIELPAFLKKMGSPKLLNLGNVAPLSYPNNFLIVHDVATLEPGKKWFSSTFKTWYRWLLPKLLKKCELGTVSQFTADRIRALINVGEKPIAVLHGGVYFDLDSSVPEKERSFDKPFILCVASHNPRKGLHLLLNAFAESDLSETFDLRIVGTHSRHFPKMSVRELDGVIWEQRVTDAELVSLYKSSSLLVAPSVYEGFGLPILEALYFGTPVLANDIEVFRELFADWIELVDCQDTIGFAEKLENATNGIDTKKPSREELYSYEQSAAKLAAIL